MADLKKPLDPYKTILVAKHNGREVGRIAATARNASAYLETLARQYGGLQVEAEEDETAGLLAGLFGPR